MNFTEKEREKKGKHRRMDKKIGVKKKSRGKEDAAQFKSKPNCLSECIEGINRERHLVVD